MSHCLCPVGQLCSQEEAFLDPVSLGKVSDAEMICRGGYAPDNVKKADGQPRDNIVREKDLYQGSLSVWRVGGPHKFEVADVVTVLKNGGPKDSSLWRIFAPAAGAIRSTAEQRGEFCILDDTNCGSTKERHPAHAVIGLCHALGFAERSLDEVKADTKFQELKAALVKLFRTNVVWEAIESSAT
jgi:hypothetical protein